MVLETRQIVSHAIQVSIWRRLNRVVIEYPGGITARWTIPDPDNINAIARSCACDGMECHGTKSCYERWVRQ